MAILLRNAILCDIDPVNVEVGDLRIDAGRISARGKLTQASGDEVVDCAGGVVMPGMVNGHTHLYSALAVGMPAPPRVPANFLEILQLVWWRLDRALDADSVECSGAIGALQALHAGTTTLIDHHASPNLIENSLDHLEKGIASTGVRGVLCYETTDRHGKLGREAGMEENRRYLEKCTANPKGRFAALVGAHASFTLEDESLDALAAMAEKFNSGVHIHVAEDLCDEAACWREHGISLIDRLDRHGILRPQSILAHGTHLDDSAIARVNAAGVTVAHNPRSNMNNAVGYAPIGKFKVPVMLGTDGIGGDMLAESSQAWFKARDARVNISPADILAMLAASARRASNALGIALGKLTVGAAGDVLITNYIPFTPMTSQNFLGHFFFGMSPRHVRHVLIDGKWALRDRAAVHCEDAAVGKRSREAAVRMWDRLNKIEP